jgi:hypothetical protein
MCVRVRVMVEHKANFREPRGPRPWHPRLNWVSPLPAHNAHMRATQHCILCDLDREVRRRWCLHAVLCCALDDFFCWQVCWIASASRVARAGLRGAVSARVTATMENC